MSYERQIGSRAQVMNGTCHHTPGGLTKKHLKYNKHGRIVSRKKSLKAKKENRLVKAGYVAKKGQFKLFKKGDGKKSRKMTRKMRGGSYSLSPAPFDGKGVGTSGVYLQTNVAGTH
jgi:hypothetical protein